MVNEAEVEKTRLAFDSAAPVYDELYEGLPGIRHMRAITSRLFLEFFPPGNTLLEINCGTGNDALFLARHGRHVLATDLSPRMIEEVEKKASRTGMTGSVTALRRSFAELHTLQKSGFDGAFSNLGGLNCTDNLPAVAAHLGLLLKPGSYFIATVMPSLCAWETLAYLSRLRWGKAFRRMRKGGTLANLHGGKVWTFYYSPRAFVRMFSPWFEHVKTVGLAVFTPPPNFTRTYARIGKGVRLLERVDETFAGMPPFRSLGDHYVTILRKRDS